MGCGVGSAKKWCTWGRLKIESWTDLSAIGRTWGGRREQASVSLQAGRTYGGGHGSGSAGGGEGKGRLV